MNQSNYIQAEHLKISRKLTVLPEKEQDWGGGGGVGELETASKLVTTL